MSDSPELQWHRLLGVDDIEDGRVTVVQIGPHSLAVTRVGDQYSALDNHCPHQRGPLGEGSIENGLLRCPWHGYDYDPLTGESPSGFGDKVPCFPTEIREGSVYVGLKPDPPHERTVGDVVVETLVGCGVRTVFGMVGHSNLGVADAMRRQEAAGNLRYIGIRHEGAGAFAAVGYAKLTGDPAACFGIAGPGSTNLLTGLYDAKADRIPVIALSGQVPSKVLGRGAFQDVNLTGAFDDVSVFSRTMYANTDHAELVVLAVKHAREQRGVSHLVFPDEVQVVKVGDEPAKTLTGRTADRDIRPPADEFARAVELIEQADRPVIIVGNGARGRMAPIIALAERLNAPVITTFKGKGLIPDAHPLAAGVLGRSGTPVASWLMNEGTLQIVFGASFSDHTGIDSYTPTIQVDTDPESLGRFQAVTVPLLGEVATTAQMFTDALGDGAWVDQRDDIAARWHIWRFEKQRRARDDRGEGLASAAIFGALSDAIPADAVIAVDVGNNTYSFGRYFESQQQDVLMSGYLGSIGFAFPAAMGAWAAVHDRGEQRDVVAIAGDGGFGQYLADFTTAVKYGMNITLVLIHNGQLGKISKEQRAVGDPVWQTSLVNPDFSEYARLCGGYGRRVVRIEDLGVAVREALSQELPAIVEVMADAELI